MGQFLNLKSELSKKGKLSENLRRLDKCGYLTAAFSSSQVKDLLRSTGSYLKISQQLK